MSDSSSHPQGKSLSWENSSTSSSPTNTRLGGLVDFIDSRHADQNIALDHISRLNTQVQDLKQLLISAQPPVFQNDAQSLAAHLASVDQEDSDQFSIRSVVQALHLVRRLDALVHLANAPRSDKQIFTDNNLAAVERRIEAWATVVRRREPS